MIKTRKQYELFKRMNEDIYDPRDTELTVSVQDGVKTIEALRRVAIAGFQLSNGLQPVGHAIMITHYQALIVHVEGLRASLAHIEQHAPWLLEGDPNED